MWRRRPVRPRRPGRHGAVGSRTQRVLLPGPRGGARPGRGLPLHDAGLRRGRGLRRLPGAAPRDAPQPGAARQVHAGPCRHHRPRGVRDGGRLGRGGRDRPAGLVRGADHLHVVVVPDRAQVPPRARPPLRRPLPRPRAGHRRPGLRRPLRTDPLVRQARRVPPGARRPRAGDHGPTGGGRDRRRGRSGPPRRAHVDPPRGWLSSSSATPARWTAWSTSCSGSSRTPTT